MSYSKFDSEHHASYCGPSGLHQTLKIVTLRLRRPHIVPTRTLRLTTPAGTDVAMQFSHPSVINSRTNSVVPNSAVHVLSTNAGHLTLLVVTLCTAQLVLVVAELQAARTAAPARVLTAGLSGALQRLCAMTTLAESFLADLDDLSDASDREQTDEQEETGAEQVRHT